MSCVHRRFGGLQEEQCLGWECWKTGLQHLVVKAMQNCLSPGFSCHKVSLGAAGFNTACVDSRGTYPSESPRACTSPMGKTELWKCTEVVAHCPAPSLAGFQAARDAGEAQSVPFLQTKRLSLSWKMLGILEQRVLSQLRWQ